MFIAVTPLRLPIVSNAGYNALCSLLGLFLTLIGSLFEGGQKGKRHVWGRQIKEAIRKQVGRIGKPAVEDLSIFDDENTG